MLRIIIVTSITNFHVKSLPSAARMLLSASESGIPPSRIPCGQIYLQKYGMEIPAWFVIRIGNTITAMIRIPYLI